MVFPKPLCLCLRLPSDPRAFAPATWVQGQDALATILHGRDARRTHGQDARATDALATVRRKSVSTQDLSASIGVHLRLNSCLVARDS
jgi:hypothetical protein